jgi:hypothetical protein
MSQWIENRKWVERTIKFAMIADLLSANPDGMYKFRVTVPSGNVLTGLAGPVAQGRIPIASSFEKEASEADIELSKLIVNWVLGSDEIEVLCSGDDPVQKEQALSKVRELLDSREWPAQ